MVTVQINPTSVPAETLTEIKSQLISVANQIIDENKSPLVTSLYLQCYDGVSNAAPWDCPHVLLCGQTHIYEELLSLKFRISPAAFFQVNIPATELLYSTVRDWCGLNKDAIILDICCGTGTIGLTIAKSVFKVIGIEMVADAIKDAQFNAELNGVSNCEFLTGKAEDVLYKAIENLPPSHPIIGIVDPPRSGLHPEVIRAIRSCTEMGTLIYVSCNQKSLESDAAALCRSSSKNQPSNPFLPIKAMAVDFFPHTPHLEAIMLFTRTVEITKQ